MIANRQTPLMTPQDYLDWEEQLPLKYNYIEGKVYTMTAGTIPHNEIAANLTTSLKNHLAGKGCKVLMADAKVGISEQGPFYYPDVMVSCDPRDKKARQVIYHPILIVEVLSPSTEGFDRGKKFAHYRLIESLREYILMSADRVNVDCYRLNDRGKWEFSSYSLEEKNAEENLPVSFPILDFNVLISQLYEGVELEEETQ
jgi:Uma2 family endonuclease